MNTYTVTPVSVAEIRVGDALLVEGRPRDVGRVVEVGAPVKSLIGFNARPRTRLYDTDGNLIGEAARNSIAYRLHTRAITALDILDGFENEAAKGTGDEEA